MIRYWSSEYLQTLTNGRVSVQATDNEILFTLTKPEIIPSIADVFAIMSFDLSATISEVQLNARNVINAHPPLGRTSIDENVDSERRLYNTHNGWANHRHDTE